MAAEPLNIYSAKIDPEGVLACLRALCDPEVTPGPGGWSRITIRCEYEDLPKPATLTFDHSPDYYAGSDFPRQMRGMHGYFAQSPAFKLVPRVAQVIASFRFALSLHPQPDPDLSLECEDDRLQYLFAVVRHLDGVIVTPSGMFDASGRVLFSLECDPDPQAVLPAY